MKYFEKIIPHPTNPELSVIFEALKDDIEPYESQMDPSFVDEIQLKFASGNKAAWFTARVIVCDKGDEENLQNYYGEGYLGGCSYDSFEEFMKSEQFKDMVKEATEDFKKVKQTHASAPTWHELTEHAIVFGTEEQFKLAQEFDSEYNEEATFLPCIIEDMGYSPNEIYPDFETSQFDDGSYEEMVDSGEIDPSVDKDTFLMDCLKSHLEDTWSPDLAPSRDDETEASTKPEFLEFLDNKLQDDRVWEAVWSEYAESLSVMTEPDPDDEDYDSWEESTLKHKVFDYIMTRQAGHGKFKEGINDLPYALFLFANKGKDKETVDEITQDIERLSKTVTSDVKWEKISPEVMAYGTSKQIECAKFDIENGEVCKVPVIVGDLGYAPNCAEPIAGIDDFMQSLGSTAGEDKLSQLKKTVAETYDPDAYSDYIEVKEEVEELKDFALAGPGGTEASLPMDEYPVYYKEEKGGPWKDSGLTVTEDLIVEKHLKGKHLKEENGWYDVWVTKDKEGVESYNEKLKNGTLLNLDKELAAKAGNDKCLTHTFYGVEIEDGDNVRIFDIEVEQCFDFEHGYGADADGNRGRDTWFFSDRKIISVEEHVDGKEITIEDKPTLDLIDSDRYFSEKVEKYDWDISEGQVKARKSN